MTGSRLEPLVEACFFALVTEHRPGGEPARIRAAEDAAARAEAALERYRDNDRAAATLGAARFADGLGRRARAVERAQLALGDARARYSKVGVDARGTL